MYWNPRKSEFLSFRGRVSEAEFPSRTIRAVLALAQQVQNTTFTVVGRISGVFVPDFFGQNRATQKLRLKSSKTQTQKLVFRVSESDFPSFRSWGVSVPLKKYWIFLCHCAMHVKKCLIFQCSVFLCIGWYREVCCPVCFAQLETKHSVFALCTFKNAGFSTVFAHWTVWSPLFASVYVLGAFRDAGFFSVSVHIQKLCAESGTKRCIIQYLLALHVSGSFNYAMKGMHWMMSNSPRVSQHFDEWSRRFLGGVQSEPWNHPRDFLKVFEQVMHWMISWEFPGVFDRRCRAFLGN